MPSNTSTSEGPRVRDYVRWALLAPSLLLVVIGLGVLALDITTETKHFVAGMLVGIGAGAALAEFAAAFERRDMHDEISQLREPLLGDCRLAYRIGEFFFAFYAAISRGEKTDRHVEEMLALTESLGVGDAVRRSVDAADPSSPTLYDDLSTRLLTALHYKGQSVPVFFSLGSEMVKMRGDDAKADAAARSIVSKQVAEELAGAERVIGDHAVSDAWDEVIRLWDRGVLTADEIDTLLLVIHAYLLVVGSENSGYLTWKAFVGDLAGLNGHDGRRPKRLDAILAEVRTTLPG